MSGPPVRYRASGVPGRLGPPGEHRDVQNVYSNADVSDEILEKIEA
ncbi:MAG TPA: hypothetical protein VGL93_35345 [Streptosporangiaceae bacterium]